MVSKQFRNNQHLLKSGGVIDRFAYFRNVTIIICISVIITFLTGGYQGPVDEIGSDIFGLMILAYLTYLLIINSFKRLREIRGTTDKELLFNAGLILLLFMPFISLATVVFLLFAKGRGTREETLITAHKAWENEKHRPGYVERTPERQNERREPRSELQQIQNRK